MASSSDAPQPPPLTSSPYPFAAAPDIIRAHQKDAYFQGVLTNQLSDLHRRLRGARSAHAWATEARTAADLLYLSLTTLLGNRTLGEEYCDLVQVEAPAFPGVASALARATTRRQQQPQGDDALVRDAPQAASTTSSTSTDATQPGSGSGGPLLPSLPRRAAYIAASILAPYLFGRVLPPLRAALRARLQARLAALKRARRSATAEYRVGRYALAHLAGLTSGAHLHAAALAVFYFTGAYYSLAKRLVGLRYVFTRRIPQAPGSAGGGGDDGRGGYEVLGVLMVVQMAVRAYLHARDTLAAGAELGEEEAVVEAGIRARAFPGGGGGGDVSLNEYDYSSNNALLLASGGGGNGQRSLGDIAAMAHTPLPATTKEGGGGGGGSDGSLGVRYDLRRGEAVMGWIKGAQQRKCTLCLEELKDPAAPQCGHVFCWACIGDWVREKPECPLCRREAMVQHILPLRAG